MSRSIFGWDYPPGAANDPNAPYNQKDPDDCPTCEGTGELQCPVCAKNPTAQCSACKETRIEVCRDCDGTGEETGPSADDIACEKADRARDLEKDEPCERFHDNEK